jgi:hypothetical protein
MSEENTPTEVQQPTKPVDQKRKAILIGVVLLLAVFAWLLVSRFLAVRDAQHEGAKSAASAMAAATLPLLDLKSKNLLGDNDTLQRVVDGIVANKAFSFAAILNTAGKVLASSDRNSGVGSDYPDFESGEVVETSRDGRYEVISPISQGTVVYGAVVLRLP